MINTILLVILGILWFVDEVLTLIDLKKFGLNREENPIAKYFVKRGKYAFTLFKVVTFSVFMGLILFIESLDAAVATVILLFVGVVYLVVDIRNFEIMEGNL